jgi:GT2 family glycosyltransferase
MIRSSPSIGIGISTKNRWKDLAVTLAHLRDEGLDRLETIVIDDGSDTPAPAELPAQFPWVKFERFEKSAGNLPRRNRLGSLLSTDFYLSLDDDSYPVAGDLEAAAMWLVDHPKVAALAFRIIFTNDPVPAVSNPTPPVLAKDFINCGALLRRDVFLAVGGFETRLHFYHEEPEYSFRTFQNGYDTYAYPSVVIRHTVTTAARPQARRTRYFIRNVVLMDLWYYPGLQSFTRALSHLPLLYKRLPKLRRHPIALVQGWLEGFFCYFSWGKLKRPLTREQLAEWNNRPGCHKATGSTTPL